MLGFVVLNGYFLYDATVAPNLLVAALRNPISRVFIADAGILLAFFAGSIHRWNVRAPGWMTFFLWSLLGRWYCARGENGPVEVKAWRRRVWI